MKGTIHWVSAAHAVEAEVRLYDHLFTKEDPSDVPEGGRFTRQPESRTRWKCCPRRWSSRVSPAAQPGDRFQFERLGYFCVDPDSTPEHLVFNRTVTLKDTWAKIEKK